MSTKHRNRYQTMSRSVSKLKIIAFNPNSIGKNPKRSEVFYSLKEKDADIVLFSDTRIGKDMEALVKAEWEGQAHFAGYSSQSRGVAMFFKKDLPVRVLEDSILKDPSGNFVVLNFIYETYTITLGCIYGPNHDDLDFYNNIVYPKVEECQQESDFILIGGDWNISLNQQLDTYGYTADNNEKARISVLEHMERSAYLDIFREIYPSKKRFTWRQFGGKKRSRLDFFLISSTLLPFIERTDISPGILSDHSIINIDIDFSKFKRGKGFFKFNNSLAKDPEYVELICHTIKQTTLLYAEDIYDENFLQNATPEQLQELILTINPQLFLETLLLEIRGKTIGYCAWKKKSKQEAQKLAFHKLEVAEMVSDEHPTDEDLRKQLQQAKEEVEIFIEEDNQAAQCRARLRWKIKG